MRLELKDVESSMVYTVDPSGAVLGRERARTDISFRDESISKRHARIFAEDGLWFLEDLGSSNGTYVRDQRIGEPTVLGQGAVFTLAQRRFEVVFIDGAKVDSPLGAGSLAGDDSYFQSELDEAPAGGLGAFFAALPRSVGHYLLSVPMLAVNPGGTVRRSVELQSNPALSGAGLAGYGLVAAGLASLVGALIGLLSQIATGSLSFAPVVSVLPMAGVAAVVGALLGLLVHPLLGAVVRLFKGDSTPRSRTNYALDAFTFTILAAVPSAVAAALASASLPLVGVIPVALTLFVSLLGVFLAYRWAVAFGVVHFVRYLLVGVGVVALVGSAAQAAWVIVEPNEPGSGSLGRIDSESALIAMRAKALADARALEQANSLGGRPALPPPGSELDIDGVPEVRGLVDEPAREIAATSDSGRPESFEAPLTDASANTPPPRPQAGEQPGRLSEYASFLQKRAAVERAIENDPSLIGRKDVREHYEPLWRITYDQEAFWKKLRRGKPRWERDKIYARKEAQEIFVKTRQYVDTLYQMLILEENRR